MTAFVPFVQKCLDNKGGSIHASDLPPTPFYAGTGPALCSIAAYAPAGNTYAAYSDEAITEKQAKGTKNQKVRHKYKLLPAANTFAQELDLFTGMGYGLSG